VLQPAGALQPACSSCGHACAAAELMRRVAPASVFVRPRPLCLCGIPACRAPMCRLPHVRR
jgi:hypothetical protein